MLLLCLVSSSHAHMLIAYSYTYKYSYSSHVPHVTHFTGVAVRGVMSHMLPHISRNTRYVIPKAQGPYSDINRGTIPAHLSISIPSSLT